MSLARFSVNQSLFVNLVSILIVVIGFILVIGMEREVYPNVSFDIVNVQTVYPGATPLDVEKLISVPLEKEIKEVDGIKEIRSTSTRNISFIYVKIDPDVADKNKVVRDVQNAVERVKDLPRDIDEEPIVTELTVRQYPVVEVSLSGEMTEQDLQAYADTLEDELDDLKGVARIRKDGYRDREIQVLVDPEKMKEYYVSIDEIESALASHNISIPAGKMDTDTAEYSVRTTGEFFSSGEIENVIIRANDSGNWLRIKDVARLEDTFKDEDVITKTFGTRSINLVVIKKESGDSIKVVNEVKRLSDKFLKKVKDERLKISYINDYSFFVKRRLNILRSNALFGLVLVVGTLLVFLQKRVAFFVGWGIPMAFFATFIVMNMVGISINMISMFALIVVLGMLVDDSIIVGENVYRYMEEGMPPREAAVKGTEEVMGSVAAAVFTTIASFMPLLFMSGIIGRFVRDIPAVVIVALLASLLEAFVCLPSHLADFIKVKLNANGKPISLTKDISWFKKIVSAYTKIVTLAIAKRYMIMAGFIAAFVVSIFIAFSVIKFILFPSAGINYFFIRMEAPIGTPLEKMEKIVSPVEGITSTLSKKEMDSFVTTIGKIEEDRHDPFAGIASNYAQITVYLTPEQDRKRDSSAIVAELREKTKDIKGFTELRFDQPETGPPVGKAVEARIRGEDFNVLDRIAKEYMDHLEAIDGATDVTWDHKPGKEEIMVRVDHAKAKTAGLTVGQIAKTVRAVFKGQIATEIKPVKAEEETDVTIRFPKESIHDVSIFDEILIANPQGRLIPLNKVAVIEKMSGATNIHHFDGKRVVTASCNVDTKKTTSLKVNKALAKKFRDTPERYMGYSVNYGGEREETIDSLKSLLRAFFFAFLVNYLVLAAFFRSIVQPFIVMFAISFGFIGFVFAFFIHGLPFSFMAILGFVSLIGVVVNDSIVLIHFINKFREQGMERAKSIIHAGQMRLRPVILTTTTTVGGLCTVAYGIGGRDPFLVPMAMAICWGLLFSTLLTLIVTPCIYAIIDDISLRVTHHTSMIRRAIMENNHGKL